MFVLAFSWSNKKKFHQLGMSNDDKDFDLAYACNARNILFIPCYKVLFGARPSAEHQLITEHNGKNCLCVPKICLRFWGFAPIICRGAKPPSEV